MIEIERTFLVKNVPEGLENCKFKEIIDVYFPKIEKHPNLRLRKNGEKYEITRKRPIDGDPSVQQEDTLGLTEEEFYALYHCPGKEVRKIRYYYPCNHKLAEVDVFQDELLGLILIDFEFDSEKEKDDFEVPDFCLADITHEEFIAGGMICGKSYRDIEKELIKWGYYKLLVNDPRTKIIAKRMIR
jgi:adenylate cyclase